MGSIIKPEVIFVILLMVVPGLLSQSVINGLILRGKDKQLDVYQCFLHSVAVYLIIYPLFVLFAGVDPVNDFKKIMGIVSCNRWAPLLTVLSVVIISIGWGWLYSMVYKCKKFTIFIDGIAVAVEPPNVYAKLLSKKFNKELTQKSHWITAYVPEKKMYIEGMVMLSSVDSEPREVYLRDVRYLSEEREKVLALPPDTAVILNIDKYNLIEISEIDKVDVQNVDLELENKK